MRNRLIGSTIVLVLAITALSILAFAHGGQRGGGRGNAATPAEPSPPHDPHDLNGLWLAQGGGGRGGRGASEADPKGFLKDGGIMTQWGPSSPLTPAGLKAVNGNLSGKGPRAVPPVYANDLLGDANPPGLIRALVYSRPFQLIQTPDKVVQLFEWTRVWREIWTDREMPKNTDPYWGRWYGYSVGKWDGDTFVVDTVGVDARGWLDEWGDPFSDQLRLTERWRRLDRDHLELVLNINDPGTYTKAWTTNPRRFTLQSKGSANGEMLEVIFAPVDERNFNEKIRDPAGKK
jgi:hypothetical protein